MTLCHKWILCDYGNCAMITFLFNKYYYNVVVVRAERRRSSLLYKLGCWHYGGQLYVVWLTEWPIGQSEWPGDTALFLMSTTMKKNDNTSYLHDNA
eukprot:4850825-Ditylum_brightwellii.AAC.1